MWFLNFQGPETPHHKNYAKEVFEHVPTPQLTFVELIIQK